MPNRLNIPDELAPLIEKRDESDRRQGAPENEHAPAPEHGAGKVKALPERRAGNSRRQDDDC